MHTDIKKSQKGIFESNIEEFDDFAAAESGGTWINTLNADFDDRCA